MKAENTETHRERRDRLGERGGAEGGGAEGLRATGKSQIRAMT